jgi:LDH2 family malate/lactate/ureidoglycolate dehydrogenase
MKAVQTKEVILKEEILWKWGKSVLDKCKMPDNEQEQVLSEIIDCNLRGVDTHGINLLCNYAERYKVFPKKPIEMVKDFKAVCMLNANGNLGIIAANIGMDKAIERAEQYGIGMSLVYDSSHYGAAGYYTRHAAERGYIGYTSTTALIDLAPWGGREHIVGKNPFSIAFPGDVFPVVLDVACSVTARNRVRTYAREGMKIPDGWALDKNGKPTNDPNEALHGLFLPMGGYKGVGIAIMIEYMIAVVCGTGFSSQVVANDNLTVKQGTAHMFTAIDPLCLTSEDGLKDQARQFSDQFHKIEKFEGVDKLYLPGEKEWDTSQQRKKNGIPISQAIIKELDDYADKQGIPHICDLVDKSGEA